MKEVVANCFKTGTSNEIPTPPIKKLKRGKININPIDIKNTGICFPWFSWTLLAWIRITIIAIIAATIE